MPTNTPNTLRDQIDARIYAPEAETIDTLVAAANLTGEDRAMICDRAVDLVKQIRSASHPGLMEVFLAEYGLSTDEGIALMCLAEALLRVPDAETIDALIEDKIAPSDWGTHLGQSASSLVNASTWALMLTGKVLDDRKPGVTGLLKGAIKRLGEPVIRTAVARAMKEMGRQFVLGENIQSAMERAAKMQAEGFTYSYDMLGEAALTLADAQTYFDAYLHAIEAIGAAKNPGRSLGISVKLSALCPRFEVAQWRRAQQELTDMLGQLARAARDRNIPLTV
ncbi:MAG: bifunctional proline dehydrogenase/L-glutamate gamma-semialdehyde dehydrogenase, partial [Rhodobacteraceae bacterium]|nr:bifunctional proline dehydrogenase/L-glutamate gamma-semialdehyde dehydrogenase [Paracoccaceae bacterium]